MAAKPLFRSEVIDALDTGDPYGAPLHLLPTWVSTSYWLLISVVLAFFGYASLAMVPDWAEGVAVVRVDQRLDVTTPVGGNVLEVNVRQGDRVNAGDTLIRLSAVAEQQELDRANQEFELLLIRVLQEPGNDGVRMNLSLARTTRDLALARVLAHSVTAPRDGVVDAVRVRQGQALIPGESLLSIANENQSDYSVVALLPGHLRPQLKSGLPGRLSLDGYPHVYQDLQIEAVGNEAVGPQEIKRYLHRFPLEKIGWV